MEELGERIEGVRTVCCEGMCVCSEDSVGRERVRDDERVMKEEERSDSISSRSCSRKPRRTTPIPRKDRRYRAANKLPSIS